MTGADRMQLSAVATELGSLASRTWASVLAFAELEPVGLEVLRLEQMFAVTISTAALEGPSAIATPHHVATLLADIARGFLRSRVDGGRDYADALVLLDASVPAVAALIARRFDVLCEVVGG